jgi:protein-S-isoprenylcysteine O-methyltransferase Ste14
VSALRYYLALLVIVAMPPGVALWVFIHPFARFWRRLGWRWTYLILALPAGGLGVAAFVGRDRLLAVEYGTSYPAVLLGLVCIVCAGFITRARRRQLTTAILAGLPELSPNEHPPRLLTEGIYGRIRHPRYVEAVLFVLGYALVSNYLAAYATFVLTLPALLLVVSLEERELRERFGQPYVDYCSRVPRFVPRRPPGP